LDVILLNHDYPPHIFGGIGNFTHELAKGLSRRGVSVHVITGFPNKVTSNTKFNNSRNTEDGVDVSRLSYPSIPPRHTLFQVWNLKKIQKIISDINADIIHGQSWATYPALLGLKNIAPILVTFHASALMEKITSSQSIFRGGTINDVFTYFIGYPAFSFTYRQELIHSDAAVSVSRSLKLELLQELGEKYSNKIVPIHNGVDIKSLDRDYENAQKVCLESDYDKSILFGGRLYWRKGALELIRLSYLLQKKNAHFKIIVHGTGPLQEKMEKYIKSLGLKNIVLKGFTTRAQLLKSMSECKFVAIPSIYEACPMILLESMCLGKIPLLLRHPFSSELTENGKYGILAESVEGLCDQLLALGETESSMELSNRIKTFARNSYNIDGVIDKYIQLYKKIS
jgi:glycosyltransferase involved in cell wall biosynthesis